MSGAATGATSSLSGCVQVGTSLAAFGAAASPGGTPQPALWRSSDGTSWARVPVSAFASAAPLPLVSLAADGEDWLAAANPDPTADPVTAGVVGARGPAATAARDAGVGPPPSIEDGQEALWLSSNGGSAWQLVDTATAPWIGNQRSQLNLVGFAQGSPIQGTSASQATATPVVVGVVDGQLAVWTGTAAPGQGSGTGAGGGS